MNNSMCNPKYFQVRTRKTQSHDLVHIPQEILGMDTRNKDQKRIEKAVLRVRAEHADPDDGL